ncbi:HAD family hydrolase [Clostridium hydrogenum]|uniref:HAD family hydrolase n=1 Tax=Clostridium hydrogenum TaxID=2855764 RepID=UPI001F2E9453|nr:HAD family hydrolase [Clostridium hydrogenum]
MYKYILFDLDGTLTDSKEGITKSVQYALNKLGVSVDDLTSLEKFIGPPLKDCFMEYYNFSESKAAEAVAYYRENFSKRGLFENEVYIGVETMLTKLKETGLHLIVATSKPTVFSEKILEHFNLAQYFDAIVGSTLDGSRSKKADVIKFALEECKIKTSEAIMIGDREHDMIGAKENGLAAIGVTYGYGSYDELEKSGATYIVNSVYELLKKIETLNFIQSTVDRVQSTVKDDFL